VKRVLFFILLTLAVAAAIGFIWTLMPAPREVHTIAFPDNLSSSYGKKSITLEFPSTLRLGEVGQAILLIRPAGGDPSEETGQIDENLNFQSRLVLPAVHALPVDIQSTQFDPPSGAEFSWRLLPASGGDFEGTLKVYASRGDPLPQGEAGELIFAIPIEIRIEEVLGLPLDLARYLSLFMLVLVGLGGLVLLTIQRKQNGSHRLTDSPTG
jgi:hypothetical protein